MADSADDPLQLAAITVSSLARSVNTLVGHVAVAPDLVPVEHRGALSEHLRAAIDQLRDSFIHEASPAMQRLLDLQAAAHAARHPPFTALH